MLGVSFDRIWQRQKRRIRRRIILTVTGTLLVLAALLAVWLANRPFDCRVTLYEATPAVEALPPMHDAVLTLALPDEERTDTIREWEETVLFRYLPARFKGRKVTMHVEAPDYLPLDTTLVLAPDIHLPLLRDPQVYGRLRAVVLIDGEVAAHTPLRVEQYDITTGTDGSFSLFIPLEKQRKTYTVSVPASHRSTTLHAPCGRNDIVLL